MKSSSRRSNIVRWGVDMKPILALIVLSCCSIQALGVCEPSHILQEHIFQGCPNLYKRDIFRVTWPDGFQTHLEPEGTGTCPISNVCCSPNQVQKECWPLFYFPTTSGSTFSQIVGNRNFVTVNELPRMCEPDTSKEMCRDITNHVFSIA